MAWTAPITHSPGDVVSAADWNTYIRDNGNYNLSGRQYVALAPYVGVADYTLTGAGSTSFADVDAAHLILTITPQSSRVRVWFSFDSFANAGTWYFDIYCTTLNARGGDANVGLYANIAIATQFGRIEHTFTGLTPGVSTSFKLQWKQNVTTNTLTLKNNAFPICGEAIEM